MSWSASDGWPWALSSATRLAIPLGIAIALNRRVSDLLRPLLTFLQSIAGIAWVPLAIIWFGIGLGSVVFVIANTIFFANLYNSVVGVQHDPDRALSGGQEPWRPRLADLLAARPARCAVQIIVGLRTSMAYGWRALVGGRDDRRHAAGSAT